MLIAFIPDLRKTNNIPNSDVYNLYNMMGIDGGIYECLKRTVNDFEMSLQEFNDAQLNIPSNLKKWIHEKIFVQYCE